MTSKKLPSNFSPVKHLNDVIRREHNQRVKEWFKDINWQDDEEDIDTPRNSLRVACTIRAEDSSITILNRLWLFEVTCGHAQSLQTPVYGIPVIEWQRETKFKPQIKLYFKEPYSFEKHGDGTERVQGEISFRIMNKTAETISRADAVEYAREIKAEFATPILTWKKGKFKCTYTDLENGYDLRLLVQSKTDGQNLVRSVLKILNKTYSDNNFQFIENTKEFPATPGTHRVYGKTLKKFRQRPNADVKFTHAQLLIPGQVKPVNLVSVSGRLKNSIENIASA